MAWTWRPSSACDLDELLDDLNPQMKDLSGALKNQRPAIMAGYPDSVGVITSPQSSSHTGTLTETTLKTFDFGRGAISSKGGFRLTAAGTCTGSGGTKTIKLKWGGITLQSLTIGTGTTSWSLVADIFNIDSTQEQRYIIKAWDVTTMDAMTVGDVGVDTL